MSDLRVMVTCPPMQRTADEWLPSLTERGIMVELPPVTQHVSRADLMRLLPLCDGIIDSIGLIDLVGFLEKDFAVHIDDEDLTSANFRTVRDIARLVETRESTGR